MRRNTEDKPREVPSLQDRIASSGKVVAPLANGEIIDYTNVPIAIVRFVRSDRMPPGAGNTRDWQKHIFRMPNGAPFALGGCMTLDQRLRSCKPGDVIALSYLGTKQLDADRTQHEWNVTLMVSTGAELRALIDECAPVYQGIAEAVAQKAQARMASSRPMVGDVPPRTDADADAAYGW